jgi:uncharacterized repeat protein (TIGR03806 family)
MKIRFLNSDFKKIFPGFFILFAISSCQKKVESHQPTTINFSKLPYKTLSEYGFFKGKISDLQGALGMLEYEPIATLFSDYSYKKRFVWMPKGVSASFDENSPDEPLNFPEKSILVKNFYYPTDFKKPDAEKRLIETRLLVKSNGNWQAYAYHWNKEQTEANYKITGGITDVSWKNENGEIKTIKYAMPNKNQCKSCHTRNGKMMPIGPKLKQLNNILANENQLTNWAKVGYLNKMPDQSKIKNLAAIHNKSASLDLKARSYLDVNCGHCHSATGPAASSGLRMNFEVQDPYSWGVKKSPVAAGMGAGSLLYDINPGHGIESIATFRMNSTHPGIMMPEIGRVSIHKEGVELIAKWIDSMSKNDTRRRKI